MPAEYRENRTSYRIAEAFNDLLLAYPRTRVETLMREILGNKGEIMTDGRFVRKVNKKISEGK